MGKNYSLDPTNLSFSNQMKIKWEEEKDYEKE